MSARLPVLQVALPVPLPRLFDYLPAADGRPAEVGARCRVPFGRRQAVGVIVGHSQCSEVPADRLLPVTEVLDEGRPLLDGPLLDLLLWCARYYKHPPGEVVAAALPPALRKAKGRDRPAYDAKGAGERPAAAARAERLRRSLAQDPGAPAGTGVGEVRAGPGNAGAAVCWPEPDLGAGGGGRGHPVRRASVSLPPARRCHRQRQDRGLHASDRQGAERRRSGAGAGFGNASAWSPP